MTIGLFINKKFMCMMTVYRLSTLILICIDPVEYARVVNEVRALLEESESKSLSLEGLAKGESTIQVLQNELNVAKSQLKDQIALN